MEKVEVFYRFKVNTMMHGQFLVDIFTLDPNVHFKPTYDTHAYQQDTQVFSTILESEYATFIKLKYSAYLAGPVIKPDAKTAVEAQREMYIKELNKINMSKTYRSSKEYDFWHWSADYKDEKDKLKELKLSILKGRGI